MTTPAPPGWYDDPHDSNTQRYWDGQNWTPHRQRKNTTPTTQQPAPAAGSALPPPPSTAGATPSDQPRVAKSQQFWSGLSRQQQIFIAVAGLVGTVVVIVFAAHPFRSGEPAYAGADKSSQSYQLGHKSGTDGDAELNAYGGQSMAFYGGGNFGPKPFEQAFKDAFNLDTAAYDNLVERDYMAGCLDALKHQSAQWTQGRKAKGGN